MSGRCGMCRGHGEITVTYPAAGNLGEDRARKVARLCPACTGTGRITDDDEYVEATSMDSDEPYRIRTTPNPQRQEHPMTRTRTAGRDPDVDQAARKIRIGIVLILLTALAALAIIGAASIGTDEAADVDLGPPGIVLERGGQVELAGHTSRTSSVYCAHSRAWHHHNGAQVRFVRSSSGLGFGPPAVNFHRHLVEYRTNGRMVWVECRGNPTHDATAAAPAPAAPAELAGGLTRYRSAPCPSGPRPNAWRTHGAGMSAEGIWSETLGHPRGARQLARPDVHRVRETFPAAGNPVRRYCNITVEPHRHA